MNNFMEKLYLVIHKYSSIDPSVYLIEEKRLSDMMAKCEGRENFCFEWDFEKIKGALVEVELKVVATAK